MKSFERMASTNFMWTHNTAEHSQAHLAVQKHLTPRATNISHRLDKDLVVKGFE
jgi:hypothetical protein